MAVSGQKEDHKLTVYGTEGLKRVRKIDHKLAVYGTEDNCLKRDLQDFCDFQDWGTCDESHD